MSKLTKYDLFEYLELTIEELMENTALDSDNLSRDEKLTLFKMSENIINYLINEL